LGTEPQVRGLVQNGNRPVSHAIIVHDSSGSWTMSGEYGFFTTVGELGDSITVYHYGFKDQHFVITNNSEYIVQLKMDPVEMDPINVKGFRPIHSNNFQAKNGRNLSSTMASIPSLSLRTYGGIGGLGTLSIDGGLTSHTKILWNGIDLTSPQNGETDISQMPFFIINNLTISRTPTLSYGSGSIDGSISITNSKTPRIKITSGSFGLRSIAGQIKIPSETWETHLGFGKLRSTGNFDYSHLGKSGKIQNNIFKQSFYSIDTNCAISNRWFISIQSLLTQQDRGIPGLVFSPSPKAKRKDALQLFNLRSIWQIPNHLFSVSLTSRQSDEHYINPQYAVDSRHDLTASQLEMSWKTSPHKSIEIDQKLFLKKEEISSTDTKNHNRVIQSYANRIIWAISEKFSNESGVRFDREKGRFSIWTWQSGLEYGMKNASVSIMAGNGFRYPTFNDMFWSPGGDPSLLPETTHWIRAHWETTFQKHNLSIRHSYKNSKNLIQWAPGETYWQPHNIANTLRNTTTITLDGELIKNIRYTAHFSYNNSKDLTQNKPLRYAPKYLGSFSIEANILSLNYWLQGQYTGERISLYSWPKDVTIAPYFIFSGGLDWSVNKQINILISVENFLNKNYMTVNSYPEPGRSFSLSIQYNPQFNRTK